VRISHLLSNKGSHVATVTPEATVSEAIASLRDHRIGALVVSSDQRHIQGMFSERDVVRALADRAAAVLAEPVSSIMSREVTTCGPDHAVESLMAIMTEKRIRHVPVVTDGVLQGIVSIGDIVKNRIDELEKDRNELVDYINAR
jgi:CBS domain-containing protein